MLNNKGFAITTILYGIMILFIMLLLAMLGILNNYKNNLSKLLDGSRDIAKIEATEKICVSADPSILTLTYTCSKTPGNKQHSCSSSNYSKPKSACTGGTIYVKDGCQRTETDGICNNPAYGSKHACEMGGYSWTVIYTYSGSITCSNYCDKGKLSDGMCILSSSTPCSSGWIENITYICTSGELNTSTNKCEVIVSSNEECPTGFTEK